MNQDFKPQTCPCPLCGTEVEVTESPWVDADSSVFQRIHCKDVCGIYEIDRTGREYANSLNEDDRAFVSQTTRISVKDNDLWGIHTRERMETLLEMRDHARVTMDHHGLRNARFKHGGGCDGAVLWVVEADEGWFALRVYPWPTEEVTIRSQLLWLSALRHESGLVVPEPVPAPDGSLYLPAWVGDVRRYCVLFQWLDGVRLQDIPAEGRTRTMIENYGMAVARLHQHAESFGVPDWFKASRRDREWFRRQLDEVLSEKSGSERDECAEIGTRVLQVMEEMGEGRDAFGLCHNDIAACNVLFHEDEPRIIDFQQWGWNYYHIDLIRAIDFALEPSEYNAFLSGYQRARPLPERFEERSEPFRAARRIENWF